MLEPLDCDAIIREHQKAEAEAYFHRLYEYFRWRPWEYVSDAALGPSHPQVDRDKSRDEPIPDQSRG
jgi:hypothetical protein